MANTIENTIGKIGDAAEKALDRIGNVVEDILGKDTVYPSAIKKPVDRKKISNLEQIGRNQRNEHFMRNSWRNDLQYTKPLVDAEYLIQTSFKIK